MEENQKPTVVLMFSVFVAVIGNPLLYGYNIGVVNTPSLILQEFYNKTYYERNGGNWNDILRYELYLMTGEHNITLNNIPTNLTTPSITIIPPTTSAAIFENVTSGDDDTVRLSPESFGVDREKMLKKWQLEILWSTTVAVFVFCGMIGAFTSGKAADYFGRKKGIILITFIMFVAAILGGLTHIAKSPELLMVSRILVGIHSGLNISLCPLYLAEIAPRRIRGSIGVFHQMGITIGILFAQILGLPQLLGTETLWPWLFAFNAVPAAMCLAMMPFCPESPRYLLLKRGDEQGARKAMERLRGTTNVDAEIEEMRVEGRKSMGVTSFTLKQLVTSPSLRLPVLIACVLQTTQQVSGINAVMSYSSFIFAQANVPSNAIPYVIVGTGTINILTTIVAVSLMEKVGRRPLLLWPMGMMCISFIIMTIFLNLMGNPSLQEHSSNFAVVCIIVAHTYIVGFALGLGPIPFIVVSEIFRQEPRAAAMSLSLVFNWMGNFILSLVFPFMKDGLQEYTYIVFSVILAAAITFIFFFVPETKTRTFDEIANSISIRRRTRSPPTLGRDGEEEPIGITKV
ncbi:hypothetical protein ACOMHN_057572 [Nucella lapillus]